MEHNGPRFTGPFPSNPENARGADPAINADSSRPAIEGFESKPTKKTAESGLPQLRRFYLNERAALVKQALSHTPASDSQNREAHECRRPPPAHTTPCSC